MGNAKGKAKRSQAGRKAFTDPTLTLTLTLPLLLPLPLPLTLSLTLAFIAAVRACSDCDSLLSNAVGLGS